MEAEGNAVFRLACIVTLIYMGFGVAVVTFWQKWSFIDSLYFVIVTLTTVGYGDHTTWKTDGAVLFAAVYALCGIMLMGTALGIIAAEVMEKHEEALKIAQKMAKDKTVNNEGQPEEDKKVNPIWTLLAFVPEEARKLVKKSVMCLLVIGIGMVLIHFDDKDRSFIMCFYYAVATGTTIGYGDISPKTQGGKVCAVFYILFAVVAIGQLLSSIAGSFIDAKHNAAMEKILQKKITMADFESFDLDGDGKIEKSEFVMRKLILMGVLDADDVERCEDEFEVMDADGSGEITMEDLALYLDQKNNNAQAAPQEV